MAVNRSSASSLRDSESRRAPIVVPLARATRARRSRTVRSTLIVVVDIPLSIPIWDTRVSCAGN
jgi:hypothetical protein